mmetsp:Transcript_47880/g.138496  ORF Transcript_47880/g.138496 Transcript_47880/m.138496 type:complete len:239 (+) Transcript_47880:967-1683(+)
MYGLQGAARRSPGAAPEVPARGAGDLDAAAPAPPAPGARVGEPAARGGAAQRRHRGVRAAGLLGQGPPAGRAPGPRAGPRAPVLRPRGDPDAAADAALHAPGARCGQGAHPEPGGHLGPHRHPARHGRAHREHLSAHPVVRGPPVPRPLQPRRGVQQLPPRRQAPSEGPDQDGGLSSLHQDRQGPLREAGWPDVRSGVVVRGHLVCESRPEQAAHVQPRPRGRDDALRSEIHAHDADG